MTEPPRCWRCNRVLFEVERCEGETVIIKICDRCHARNRIVLGEVQPYHVGADGRFYDADERLVDTAEVLRWARIDNSPAQSETNLI